MWTTNNTTSSMSATNNTTTATPPQQQQQEEYIFLALPQGLKIALYTLYCFVFLIGVSGNLLVIYVIGIKHRLSRSCDVHIVALAISDLLTAIFIPMVMIHDTVTDYMEWHLLGDFGCKLFVPMMHLTSIVSSLMLITISLTRVKVIYSSRAVSRGICRSVTEVTVVWVLSITIVSPYMYHLTIIDSFCYDVWDPESKFVYFTIVQTISCFLAVVIMVVVYTLSAIHLFRHAAIPGDNKAGEERRIKQNQRVTRMFGGIVFVFFALTTPYAICFFIVAYYGTYDLEVYFVHEKLFFYVNQILYAVAALNCCVNPFIYARMHRNMKQTVWKKISLSLTFLRSTRNENNNNLNTISNSYAIDRSMSMSLSPISSRSPSPSVTPKTSP